MKIWTAEEIIDKVKLDLDLEDETFISQNEFIGYINEALAEAESEIMELHQDYFLTKGYIPLVQGTSVYDLPRNIYANRIRGIMYLNGNIQYPINKYQRRGKFADIANTSQFGASDDYRYHLQNDNPGQASLVLLPAARESAVLAPQASLFVPAVMWYIRNCARVPVVGEFCNPEVIPVANISAAANTIQSYNGQRVANGIVSQGYPGPFPGSISIVAGDSVRFRPSPGGTLPSPLVEGTTYYAKDTGSGLLKLFTTRANAINGAPEIDITTAGTGYVIMEVAATTAIINATLIDIPEFSTFVIQWVKCRCYEKEGDPRLDRASATLVQQKQQMIDTLVQGIEDDNDQVQADFSHYFDMA
jgi:hypothetical protein